MKKQLSLLMLSLLCSSTVLGIDERGHISPAPPGVDAELGSCNATQGMSFLASNSNTNPLQLTESTQGDPINLWTSAGGSGENTYVYYFQWTPAVNDSCPALNANDLNWINFYNWYTSGDFCIYNTYTNLFNNQPYPPVSTNAAWIPNPQDGTLYCLNVMGKLYNNCSPNNGNPNNCTQLTGATYGPKQAGYFFYFDRLGPDISAGSLPDPSMNAPYVTVGDIHITSRNPYHPQIDNNPILWVIKYDLSDPLCDDNYGWCSFDAGDVGNVEGTDVIFERVDGKTMVKQHWGNTTTAPIRIPFKGPYNIQVDAAVLGNHNNPFWSPYTPASERKLYVPPADFNITKKLSAAGPGGYAKAALVELTPSENAQKWTSAITYWTGPQSSFIDKFLIYQVADANGDIIDWDIPVGQIDGQGANNTVNIPLTLATPTSKGVHQFFVIAIKWKSTATPGQSVTFQGSKIRGMNTLTQGSDLGLTPDTDPNTVTSVADFNFNVGAAIQFSPAPTPNPPPNTNGWSKTGVKFKLHVTGGSTYSTLKYLWWKPGDPALTEATVKTSLNSWIEDQDLADAPEGQGVKLGLYAQDDTFTEACRIFPGNTVCP